MSHQEVGIEISYAKKFNLGNYSSKDYIIKLSGTESQIEEQFKSKNEKLQGFLEGLESLVELAHEANLLKARLPKTVTPAAEGKPVRGQDDGGN